MLTNIVYVKALTLFLFAAVSGTSVGLPPPPFLLPKEARGRVGAAGNEVRQGTEQQAQQNPAIRAFNYELLKKCRELENEIDAAKTQAVRSQKQERQEMAKRDEQAIEKAAEDLGKIRQAVLTLRNDPWVRFMEVYVTMPEFSSAISQRSRASSVRRYETWSRRTPRQTLAIIDRVNADQVLAQAEQAFQRIAQASYVPTEILDRHRRELEEYRMLENNSLTKIKTLRLQALGAMRALADQPDTLESEMAKRAQDIDQEIDAARDTLARLIVDYPAARRAEPIGFSTREPSSEFRSRTSSNANLVLVVRIRPEYFTPSVEEYQQLDIRSFGRLELVVLDSRLFRLILQDGKPVPPVAFVDSDSWGGNVVFDSAGKSSPGSRRRVNHHCILGFEGTVPSTLEIQIGWLLDPKDAAPPFKLQFAKFGLAPVPDKPLEPQTSEDQSQETPSAPTVQ